MFAPIAHFAAHQPNWAHTISRSCSSLIRKTVGSRGAPTSLPSMWHLRSGGKKPPSPGGDKPSPQDGDDKNGKAPMESEDPEDEMTARVTFFVFGAFVASYVLYRFAMPSGELTGWSTIIGISDKITDVFIYQNYVQVVTDDKKYHLGTYDDEHTNEKLTKVHDHYKEGQEVNFEVLGTPLAEKVLYGFGIVAWIVPFIFFPSFVMILTRAMGTAVSTASGDGRSKIKQMNFVVQWSSNTRFHDIAGMKEAKKEITEIVDFLRTPERYTRLGAKIPTGALLLGPPGTGKTLLAKAVAGEAGIGFIPVCGSDFVELYVGMGALRVRQLFELAKKQRCIVYIDEIDAIGMKRRGAGHGEKQEQEHTLNELLTQLDGFGSSRGQVMILASSNVPQDQLDPALIRPGRFDRIVYVDSPVVKERIEIFQVHLCKLTLVDPTPAAAPTTTDDAAPAVATPAVVAAADGGCTALALSKADNALPVQEGGESPTKSSVVFGAEFDIESLLKTKSETERRIIENYAERMSGLCPGFVGADIANVCNEAAILAARENCTHVSIGHLERSIDRVLAGIEHRSRVLSDFEKRVVAHHEAGHAVAGWFLKRADPLMKVSIVPRGGSALGYAQYLPNESKSRTANEIFDSMCVTLGGRVAERIFFDHLSTGASDDLQKVCRMAYSHVTSFGGVTVYHPQGSEATRYVKPFGAAISDKMDDAAKVLVDKAYDATMKLLTEKKFEMELLAQHLLKHELLTYDDVVKYLGGREVRDEDRKRGI
jgi:AFG3 family protein